MTKTIRTHLKYLLLAATAICLGTGALADSGAAPGGQAARAMVHFSIIIPPTIAIDTAVLSSGNLETQFSGMRTTVPVGTIPGLAPQSAAATPAHLPLADSFNGRSMLVYSAAEGGSAAAGKGPRLFILCSP